MQRADATDIYRARIVSVEKGSVTIGERWPSEETAVAEVIEVFKGDAKVGVRYELPAGGGGDCTIPFSAGEWLIYGFGSPLKVDLCSRTRKLSASSDPELTWLRTGKKVATPVALQRESVRCKSCTAVAKAEELTGVGGTGCCGLDDEAALAAWKAKKPFWTGSYYQYTDPGKTTVIGQSPDGGGFELIQDPFWGEERCRQRVTLRQCSELRPRVPQPRGMPVLECVGGSQAKKLCDENESRRANWNPIETLNSASCDWRDPAAPVCRLNDESTPVDAGTLVFPLLQCSPSAEDERRHTCHVVETGADGGTRKR